MYIHAYDKTSILTPLPSTSRITVPLTAKAIIMCDCVIGASLSEPHSNRYYEKNRILMFVCMYVSAIRQTRVLHMSACAIRQTRVMYTRVYAIRQTRVMHTCAYMHTCMVGRAGWHAVRCCLVTVMQSLPQDEF